MMFRREKLQKVLRYEDLKYAADYHLWLDFLFYKPELNIKFAILPQKSVFYLLHNQSMSSEKPNSDLALINNRRNYVIQNLLYGPINDDGAFDDNATEAIVCFMLNLKHCSDIKT